MNNEATKCTWTTFYQELADKLLSYKSKRGELIAKLRDAYDGMGMKFPKLDSTATPADIDPYTVFGLFNKGITTSNRNKIIAQLAKTFDVRAELPSDYDGIPILNNLNATFYAFSDDSRRHEHDIDNLWQVFEKELVLADNPSESARVEFVRAFDETVGQFGLGWKLTMGIYWARPFAFINLDSRNRWFVGDIAAAGPAIAGLAPKEKGSPIPTGEEYLAVCEAIRSRLGTEECPFESFPQLSDAAFRESERVNKEKEAAAKAKEAKDEENSLGDGDVETVHYWLYAPGAGASMWDDFYDHGIMGLGWSALGDLSEYATKEDMRARLQELSGGKTSQKNATHAVWQFVHDLKPGDVVFAKRGRSRILGRGVVTGEYSYDVDGGEYPNVRSVDWTDKGEWTSDDMFAMKTLTDVTDYTDFLNKVNDFFEEEDEGGTGDSESTVVYPPYSEQDFLSEVYMDAGQYETLTGLLRAKKNVILQGAPGVGKTFASKRLAYSMMGVKDVDRVMMVQFHQSYSYEDFIEGYRPSTDGFELTKGAFYTFCKRAADDPDNDYFFIIDEINRGNLSKIFGELFMLIESDKRGPKNKLQLLYSRELFYVPSNVFLIGMMNTADRSLAMLDYALRRRFAFFDLTPAFSSNGFAAYREGLGSDKFNELIACVMRLNSAIASDETLGEGFCVGHSYFCGLRPEDVTEARLSAIVEYELVPLLREYWFDEPANVREWSDGLRRAIR